MRDGSMRVKAWMAVLKEPLAHRHPGEKSDSGHYGKLLIFVIPD
jgi:hypothetical protein